MSEFIETTGGSVIGSAVTPLAGVSGTAPCPFINGSSPRHQETGRVSRFNFFTSRSPAPLKSAATAVWHAGLRSCRPARVSVGPVWGHGRVLAHGVLRDGELAGLESAISLWGTDRTAVFSAPFGERRSNDSGRLNSGCCQRGYLRGEAPWQLVTN